MPQRRNFAILVSAQNFGEIRGRFLLVNFVSSLFTKQYLGGRCRFFDHRNPDIHINRSVFVLINFVSSLFTKNSTWAVDVDSSAVEIPIFTDTVQFGRPYLVQPFLG
jgi:hypothetical protein